MCERSIAEYEEERSSTKQHQLDAVLKKHHVLFRTDIHQLTGSQETCVPHLQGETLTLEHKYPQSPHVKEEGEDQQPPNIKEEREDSQHSHVNEVKELIQPPYIKKEGHAEADPTKLPLTVVSVKTEDHEEKPPESSQLDHSPNVCEEHRHEHQKWTSRMKQEELQPPHIKEEEVQQPPHIKEEEEEPQHPDIKKEWEKQSIGQEETHLDGPEDVGVPKMPLTGVTVTSEDEFKGYPYISVPCLS
ncbi:involucrin-like isoform X7 [Nerophis ophidion]|uniref:involucrin-like isoform X7 n=1 Tax=Nerophis ophidion TaxID=159077 RepID=UPI002ADFA912|nr:involucrin-like isoform X7 [Nerophis ophidion]